MIIANGKDRVDMNVVYICWNFIALYLWLIMLGYCNKQRKIRKMVLGFIKVQEIEEDYLLDDMKPSKMEDFIFYLSFGYPLAIHLYALFSII